ncbi:MULTISPECIES: rhomboid family intramembrane serine protease [Corynebacterium]|uniref:rhomboid family intramembrane serine protease n=1 Tax=Corynebacterium TaxID=1716 RepID=UPI00165975FE|nr:MULTISPECIES: rhomboid family intramembrane serine protease [Corynebacterium]QNP92298.1 rhomboid family intramembrane serine protease [Corynebacterium zhongnanshanii]
MPQSTPEHSPNTPDSPDGQHGSHTVHGSNTPDTSDAPDTPDAASTLQRTRTTVRTLVKEAPVTWTFLSLCLGVYLVMLVQSRSLTDTMGGFSYVTDQYGHYVRMLDHGIGWDLIFASISVTKDHQWWRIFTASVVHLDVFHLMMNSLMIFLLGKEVEKTYGGFAMLCAIVAGAAGGSLACMYGAPNTPVGGASTVAYALCALLVAVSAQTRQPLSSPMALIGVNLGFSLSIPGVSLWGHLGGLAAGVVLALIFYDHHARVPTVWLSIAKTAFIKGSPVRLVLATLATLAVSVAAVYVGLNGLY